MTNGLKYIILILLLLVGSLSLYAQEAKKKIKILHADRLTFKKGVSNDAQRLIGNVKLDHEGAIMDCDSAYLFENNSLEAYNNVKINQGDTIFLYGDTLYYNGNTGVAKVRGDVTLIDKDMTLTTNFLDYNLKTNVSDYYKRGKIVSKENNNVLESNRGIYVASEKMLYFRDSVSLVNPEYTMLSDTLQYHTETEIAYFFGPTTITGDSMFIYCENGWYDTKNDISQFGINAYIINKEQTLYGDSIFYNKNLGYGEVFRNVLVVDTINKFNINGDYALYREQEGSSIVTGNTLFTQFMEDDTLYLHADTLIGVKDSATNKNIIYAYYNTRFFKNDLQGVCDSLIFSDPDSLIKMFTKPILWSDENQISGDYIEILTYDSKVHQMDVFGSSFIISQADTFGFNQIKGKDLTAYFKDGEIHKIHIVGNGQTLYFAAEEEQEPFGVNKGECSEMFVYIEDKKMQKINFMKSPTATLYPLDDLKENDLFLNDFLWHIKKRPLDRYDIFRKVD
jgi:lipopolysaccharide export system protein LptA